MHIFKSRYDKLPGTSYAEVIKAARHEYHIVQKRTPRRQAYIKSRYFQKDKVFINQFWDHLKQKHPSDQLRRLRFYKCALDLLRNSTHQPSTRPNPNARGEKVHRFIGQTKSGESFAIQVKEKTNSGRKDFMSVFPYK